MSGKGDRYRPVDMKKYSENYDRIFRKAVKDKDKKKKTGHHNV